MKQTQGIHHITVVSSDAQKIAHFYGQVLGMRLVKKTVNFDDETAYHLYYGDGIGRPGSGLTFFPYGDLSRHEMGRGMIQRIDLAIPEGSLTRWRSRLESKGISTEATFDTFGKRGLQFEDPDGLRLRLVETEGSVPEAWPDMVVPQDMAIRTAIGVRVLATFPERESGHTTAGAMLIEPFGFAIGERVEHEQRYVAPDGTYVDVVYDPQFPMGRRGAGYIHHIAFRAANQEDHLEIHSALHSMGTRVSPVMDRNYFESIYVREPGGVLYEVATDGPGFLIDEPFESLGQTLRIPPHFEPRRAIIEKTLPALDTRTTSPSA